MKAGEWYSNESETEVVEQGLCSAAHLISIAEVQHLCIIISFESECYLLHVRGTS